MSCGPAAVSISPAKSTPLNGVPIAFMARSVGSMISLHDAARSSPRHHRRRRIGAHAAGIRARVAVADALVVLRRGERDGGLAVAQREEG